MKKTLIMAALAGLLALSARADIIPTLTSVTPSGSNFTFIAIEKTLCTKMMMKALT